MGGPGADRGLVGTVVGDVNVIEGGVEHGHVPKAGGILAWSRTAWEACMMVCLMHSAMPFVWGWWSTVVRCVVPNCRRWCVIIFLVYSLALSEIKTRGGQPMCFVIWLRMVGTYVPIVWRWVIRRVIALRVAVSKKVMMRLCLSRESGVIGPHVPELIV